MSELAAAPRGARTPQQIALALVPGTLLAGVASGIVFPIFPIVGEEVGLSKPFIGAILAANRAMRVVCAPLVGVIADRFGARRTLLVGLALQIAVIGLYIVGLVAHREGAGFLIGRLLHGPSSACVFVAASALAIEASSRAAAAGGSGGATAATVRAAMVLGVPVGFVIGGLLAEVIGNVATFGVAGGAVIVALGVAALTVPDLRAPMTRRPRFADALREMHDRRLLGIGGLNFALNFAAGGMVLSTLGFVVSSRHLVVFGRDERGTAGLLMAVMSVTDAAFTTWAGRLGDRYRAHGRIAAVSLAIVAVGLAGVGLAGDELGTAIAIAIVGLGAAGLGPSVLVMVGAVAAPDRRGTAAGFMQLCGDAGAMLGPLIGSAVFAETTALPYLLTAGLVLAFVPVALWLARTTG